MASSPADDEWFDVLSKEGARTPVRRRRGSCHREGLWHRAAHVWVVRPENGDLLLQRRALCKDTWPGLWDISSAGHVLAGEDSETAALRELEEEIGIKARREDLRQLFSFAQDVVLNDGAFLNREHVDVFLFLAPPKLDAAKLQLQESEVAEVRWITRAEYRKALVQCDPGFVPAAGPAFVSRLFSELDAIIGSSQ